MKKRIFTLALALYGVLLFANPIPGAVPKTGKDYATTGPTVHCPNDVIINTDFDFDPGDCAVFISDVANPDSYLMVAASGPNGVDHLEYTFDDHVNPPYVAQGDATGYYNVGVTTLTYAAYDSNGDSGNTCSFTVTVTDNENPTITCPPDVTINSEIGICGGILNSPGTAQTSDNCQIQSITHNGSFYPLGFTADQWTVTDLNGNMATCQQFVTVIDPEGPTITCPPGVSINMDGGSCTSSFANLGNAFAIDNCFVVSTIHNIGTYSSGVNIVTWTTTDGAGQTATCTQIVMVEDHEYPTIICPPNTTVSCASNTCGAFVSVSAAQAADNCSYVAITNNFNNTANASGTYPVGTNTVVWTATDGSNNTGTCAMTVKVQDNRLPNITCPANQIKTAGNLTLPIPVMSDNCGINHYDGRHKTGITWSGWTSQSNLSGPSPANGNYSVGVYPIQYQVFDNNGNSKCCQFTLTVIPPLAQAPEQENTTDALPFERADAADENASHTLYCYPNPFHRESHLQFELKEAAPLHLSILDLSGREVQVLLDGNFDPGKYEYPFNAAQLLPGVYVARLRAGRNVEVAKLIVF